MNTVTHVAWVERSKGDKTVWLDGRAVGGPFDEVKYIAFRGEAQHQRMHGAGGLVNDVTGP